jgi:uncharacterized protein DUF732
MASTRTRKRGLRLALLAGGPVLAVGLLGQLGAAAPAHANGADDAFVQALHAHNITHESNQAAISAGHLVCHQLDMGKTQEQIATDVMNSSGMDGDDSGFFVAVAERAYCPQYADMPS